MAQAHKIKVKPDLLDWAHERARLARDDIDDHKSLKNLALWKSGEDKPTLKQLEAFARATYTPVGYFFLSEPPEDNIPIPDLRTVANQEVQKPSPNLLDTIYRCQQRQEWYRDYALRVGEESRAFVGSVNRNERIEEVALKMRNALEFTLSEQAEFNTWQDAKRVLIQKAESLGILVMASGIAGSNTRRKLSPGEFRGFALSDPLAPVIFINGADTKAAQIFTLAHELAHIWLGESALSKPSLRESPSHSEIEKWCNAVAAEFLVPIDAIKREYAQDSSFEKECRRLAKYFKVSTLVIMRRLRDAGFISRESYEMAYADEYERLIKILRNKKEESGGNYYSTQCARVSPRFAKAIITSAYAGQSSFTEAFHLLGTRKMATFQELGSRLGVDV